MGADYSGPIRDERLAIELHNTVYAANGAGVDAFSDATQARSWLTEIVRRDEFAGVPDGPGPPVADLLGLRSAVRSLVASAAAGSGPARADVDAVNAAAAAAPRAPRMLTGPGGAVQRGTTFGEATRQEVVLATFAADAIELLTGPLREQVRICGAPGCVLAFLRTNPRRAWCSNGCGNRARQARHYHRTHGDGAAPSP